MAGLISAKSIVEIGTGSGLSGLAVFRGALSDSSFTSIDSDRDNSELAREIFDEAGISSQRFRLITGNIIEVVGKLADGNYDMVIVRYEMPINLAKRIYAGVNPGFAAALGLPFGELCGFLADFW